MSIARRTYDSSNLVVDTGATTAGTVLGAAKDEALPEERLAARSLSCTVDFGDGDADMASTTITGVAWVASDTRFACTVVGRPDRADDEDALLEEVKAIVTNISDGVSFDVVAHAPNGTSGAFTVHVVGV